MHSLTRMSVVVCVVRKPRPCNSYSRRRDRINSVLWRSYYKGGGGGVHSRVVPQGWTLWEPVGGRGGYSLNPPPSTPTSNG